MGSFFKKNSGISLLEVLLSLAIAAMVITLGVRYFHMSRQNEKSMIAVKQINQITQASFTWIEGSDEKFYDPSATEESGISENLIDAHLLDTSDFTNPWGGVITLHVNLVHKQLALRSYDMPVSACTAINDLLAKQVDHSGCGMGGTEYYGKWKIYE